MEFDAVLDENRLQILPLFRNLPQDFYLSGGTALALQLKHRVSDDFDFFSPKDIDTENLLEELAFNVFEGLKLTVVQQTENTLDVITEKQIKISFLRYRYPIIQPLIQTPFMKVADKLDIGATKLVAVAQRASQKDFYDLFFLLKSTSLETLFNIAARKYPSFDPILYLKALTYYDDCDSAKPKLLAEKVGFDEVQRVLTAEAKALFEALRSNE